MVLTHPFRSPTAVIEGHPYDEAIVELIGSRSWALITSEGWVDRGAVKRLRASDTAAAVITSVAANPTVAHIVELTRRLPNIDIVVALGGGSVIDAAKGMLALQALGEDTDALMAHLRDGNSLPAEMRPGSLIAVPTTAGTGSEVTRWGTIWGDDGIKHSVNDPKLYPSRAVIDPALTLSMPEELTLSTGLDALSHAMESVWNRRHTAVSDALAEKAIAIIKADLLGVLGAPKELEGRRRIQTAALLAGLAMGTTQTALAHSVSYPFTANFGMPHGLACSFTLAEVARFNAVVAPERLMPIAAGLGCTVEEIPDVLEAWFWELRLGEHLANYVDPTVTDHLGNDLITRSRAANNIRQADGATARILARAALDRLHPQTGRRIEVA